MSFIGEDPNSGVLTQLTGSPITAGPAVASIAIHPSNKFLYAANSGEGDISLFQISSIGGLNEVTPRTPVTPNGTVPTLLAMDAAGTFLYVGNVGSGNISVFSIDASTGALAAVGTPFPIGNSSTIMTNLKLSPSGGFLYVTVGGSPGYIEAFSLNQGVPTVVNNSPFTAGTNPERAGNRPRWRFSIRCQLLRQFHLGIHHQHRRIAQPDSPALRSGKAIQGQVRF